MSSPAPASPLQQALRHQHTAFAAFSAGRPVPAVQVPPRPAIRLLL